MRYKFELPMVVLEEIIRTGWKTASSARPADPINVSSGQFTQLWDKYLLPILGQLQIPSCSPSPRSWQLVETETLSRD